MNFLNFKLSYKTRTLMRYKFSCMLHKLILVVTFLHPVETRRSFYTLSFFLYSFSHDVSFLQCTKIFETGKGWGLYMYIRPNMSTPKPKSQNGVPKLKSYALNTNVVFYFQFIRLTIFNYPMYI